MTDSALWWRTSAQRAAMYAQIDRLTDAGLTQGQIRIRTGVNETTISRRQQERRGRARSPIGRPLSAQQMRVIARMADRDEPSTAKAAADLGVSRSAVEQTLSRAYGRLGVHTLLGAYRVLVVEQDQRLPNWRQPV